MSIRTIGVIILLCCAAAGLHADSPFTGREEIRTEYLRIIFEPTDGDYAQELARFGDREVEILGDLLGHIPKKPIPVVITSRSAFANGYYSPLPHSITLYITSPSDRFIGSVTEDWLRTLFIHELTHYIHFTSPVGLPKYLAPVFGPDITMMNSIFMPGWWYEGITTYTESTYAPGGRGSEARFEQTWKAPMLEDSMWSYGQSAYPGPFPPAGRIYSAGYLFTEYLIDRFGEDIFRKANSEYARFPFLGISSALRRVTGTSGRDLYREMVSERKGFYQDSTFEQSGTQISPEGYGNYYLPVATDHGLIGWASHLRQGRGFYRYDGQGSADLIYSSPVGDIFSFDVTPDGTRAAVSLVWIDAAHPGRFSNASVSYADLFIIDLVNGISSRITQGRRLLHPVLHPEGTMIAAIEPVGSRYRMVLIDLETGEERILYDHTHRSIYEPRFSPDGSKLAAVESIRGHASLVEISLDGDVSVLWPHQPEGLFSPRYLDQDTLLYSAQRGDAYRLYTYKRQTGETFLVLEDPVGVLGGISSGDKLVFSAYRSSGYTLHAVPLQLLEPRLVDTPQEQFELDSPPAPVEHYESTRYRDIPRMGLWLPLPLVEGDYKIAPGALLMMQGILGTQQLQVQGGWFLDQPRPTLSANYFLQHQWGTLLIEGGYNQLFGGERIHQLGLSVNLPLYSYRDLQSSYGVSLFSSALWRIKEDDSLIITLGTGWQQVSHAPRGAFFGSHQAALTVGSQASISQAETGLFPFASGLIQRELPWRNQAVRTSIDGAAIIKGFLNTERLYPARGTDDWGRVVSEARAKLRGTLDYRIPIAMTDIPVPFGGITGFGLSLFAQSALYVTQEALLWEETVYAGAEFTTEFSLSGLGSIRPSVGITVNTFTGDYAPFINLTLSGLITGFDEQENQLGVSY